MKIVQLKTHMPIKTGMTRAESFFTTENHTLHKELKMEVAIHPVLGAGVMLETAQLKKDKRVSFCPVNNIEEITFAKDDEPVSAKAKK